MFLFSCELIYLSCDMFIMSLMFIFFFYKDVLLTLRSFYTNKILRVIWCGGGGG